MPDATIVRVTPQVDTTVVRVGVDVTTVAETNEDRTHVVTSGGIGPRGLRGIQGPPGEAGPGSIEPFHFEQPDPENTWQINHGRNSESVSVTLRDGDGTLMFAPWAVQSPNQIVVSFPSPQVGSADLVF